MALTHSIKSGDSYLRLCALGLILASGGTWSISRTAYGIVSLSVAPACYLSVILVGDIQ